MKHTIKFALAFLLLFVTLYSFSQKFETKDGTGFHSVFQSLKNGEFSGKVSGKLLVLKSSGETVKIDIKNENADLKIEPDKNEIYDVSRKIYSCSNSGANVNYTTYALANAFFLKIDGLNYGFTAIDGACTGVIKNIDYSYRETNNQEELRLQFDGNVDLSNPDNHVNSKFITILQGSKISFKMSKLKK